MNERVSGLERIVFMSDAVFAIALTLLVLDVRLPDLPWAVSAQEFARGLAGIAPQILCYVMSFLVLGLYWSNHHHNFSYIVRYDSPLIWFNLIQLLFVALLPFPTRLIAEHSNQTLAWVVYALNNIAINVCGLLAFWHAWRGGLMLPNCPERLVWGRVWRSLYAVVFFSAAILVAWINPLATGWVLNVLLVSSLLLGLRTRLLTLEQGESPLTPATKSKEQV
jgi:uncharacterized membrane protein